MPKETQKVYRRKHMQLALIGLIVLVALIAVNFQALPGKAASLDTAYNPSLLFGDNLVLNDSNDAFLTSSALRTGLQNVHTQIIRLPVRGPAPNVSGIVNWSAVQQAAQDIKAMGLTPLIILRNPNDPTLSADDTQVVSYMSSLFGTSVVYYEFGNETDLPGTASTGFVAASAYVTAWNTVIPQLKVLEPSAQFIGPVNFQYDVNYLTTFLSGANPQPDAISWHEYTCNAFPNDGSSTATQETNCLNHINNNPGHDWPSHISAARTLMTSTIGKQLPIWITEWNYAPVVAGSPNDPKASDNNFLTQWTTTAIETLASNNIAASMHYNVDNLLPLVNSNGSIATEGAAFQSEYVKLVVNATPTPTTGVTPTPTTGVTPTPTTGVTPTPTTGITPTPPPTGNVIAQDTFQRSNQTYWGTASDGQSWGGDANTVTNFSITNNAGQIVSGSGAYNAVLGPVASDEQVLFSGSISGFTSSNLGAVLRWTDTNNWYKAYIDGASVVIQKKVAGTATTLATVPLTTTTGTSYSIRFQVMGTKLAVKVWPTANSEPSAWTATASDSSLTSGQCGLRIQVLNGAVATITSFLAQNPAPIGTIAQDTFQRSGPAIQTYWGTATDGQVWGGDANTASNFTIVAGSIGWINTNSGPQNAILGPSVTDANVVAVGYLNSFSNSNFGVVLRWTDTNNWYKAYFDGTSLVIQKKVNGIATILTSVPFAAQPDTSYNLLFQVFGNALMAKVWTIGFVQPDGWMALASDSSLTSGHAGLRIQTLYGPAEVSSFLATTIEQ